MFRFSAATTVLSPLRIAQTGCKDHSASYSMRVERGSCHRGESSRGWSCPFATM